MDSTKGTAPAWQVRESARQTLLEGIQRDIIRKEEDLGRSNLQRTLLYVLNRELTFAESEVGNNYPSDIRLDIGEKAFAFFYEVFQSIRQFQRSKKEGDFLFAKLLEWTAGEIARPYHSALLRQEIRQPERIFGAKGAMDEVPLE